MCRVRTSRGPKEALTLVGGQRAVLGGVRGVAPCAAAPALEGAQHGAQHAAGAVLERVRAVVRLALAVVLAEAALLQARRRQRGPLSPLCS